MEGELSVSWRACFEGIGLKGVQVARDNCTDMPTWKMHHSSDFSISRFYGLCEDAEEQVVALNALLLNMLRQNLTNGCVPSHLLTELSIEVHLLLLLLPCGMLCRSWRVLKMEQHQGSLVPCGKTRLPFRKLQCKLLCIFRSYTWVCLHA